MPFCVKNSTKSFHVARCFVCVSCWKLSFLCSNSGTSAIRTKILRHCVTLFQPYEWSTISNTPLPKRLPPKLPIDCILLSNPRCLVVDVRIAKASVAISCVAEAAKAKSIIAIRIWK